MSPLLFLRCDVSIRFLKKKTTKPFFYCFIQNMTLNSTQNRGMTSECIVVLPMFSLRTRLHVVKEDLRFSHSLHATGIQLEVQLRGLCLKICRNFSEFQ